MNRDVMASCLLHPNSLRRARLIIWLIFISLAQPFAALAQTTTPAPLPPAAQEAVNKGIIAARVPDYLLAIRFFEEARKIAPEAPVIYLNLGLAESKIPGRELRAMTWFGAYLTAYPDAPNAVAVKEQIIMLDIKNQSELSRFLKTVEDAANQISNGDRKADALYHVSGLWLNSSDIARATRTADGIDPYVDKYPYRSSALFTIADAQIKAGDILGAQKTAGKLQALKASQEITTLAGLRDYKGWAQARIGGAQVLAGNIAGAQTTAAAIVSDAYRNGLLASIAIAQAIAGDIAGAQKTADGIQDADDKDLALVNIASAQARAGDIAGAQKTADKIQGSWKGTALVNIASAQKTIAAAQAKTSPEKVVSPAANVAPPTPPAPSVDQWFVKNDELLNKPVFLDLGSYLKSLPQNDADRMLLGLLDAAKKITAARQVITQMLKQQAQQPAKP